MVLKVLMENTAQSDMYVCEHGLSFYIETGAHKILFDMGQSDAFIKNAAALGVDLSMVDIAVLSHGHYDHGGGLSAFLKLNKKAKVYIQKNAFKDYYAADGRYLGLDKSLEGSERVLLTDDAVQIDDALLLFTSNSAERKHPMDTFGLFKKQGEALLPDDFLHEQYLMITENNKCILISGCSHKGILNIMDWVDAENVCAVFGGFHFMKLDTEADGAYLRSAAEALLTHDATYYTGHCTGGEQYAYLKNIMGDKLAYASAGATITI